MTHYLDHAATSPLLPEALEAWVRVQRDLQASPGNPAALHAGGRRARRMLEDARDEIASLIGADIHEVVFTSGATESDILAVSGTARGVRRLDERRTCVVLSGIEHDAVAEQGPSLALEGFDIRQLPVDKNGISVIDRQELLEYAPRIAVASLAMVSSEIGTIQPVGALVETLRGGGASASEPSTAACGTGVGNDVHTGSQGSTEGGLSRPYVHTDAAQAVTTLDVDFGNLGVDLMSLGGHKLGAPSGSGVLVVKRGIPLKTDRVGGGHERGIRSGSPDVAGAVSFAAALRQVVLRRDEWKQRAKKLRERLIAGLPKGVVPTVEPSCASASIIHLSIPTARPEAVLMSMDMAGVMVSAGSACHSGVTRPSEIVMRMGRNENEALGVLRVSLGWTTQIEDIDAFLRALPNAIAGAQALDQVTHVGGERSTRMDAPQV